MDKNEIIDLYKQAFPQSDHEADAGYIFGDGTLIDPTSKINYYCHGKEFYAEPSLAEWRTWHPELPNSNRMAIDAIMNEIGAIEFTIDNCHLQCVRLPNKPLTAEQRQPLSEIIGKILERGLVRVEVLGTSEYTEYDARSNTTEQVMSKIEAYYSIGHLQA